MPKRKAETLSQVSVVNGSKKVKHEEVPKLSNKNLLDDSESSSSGDESGGGVFLEEPEFKINEEYAKRFEHNKKREELQRRESMASKFKCIC
jgi:protein KRI1